MTAADPTRGRALTFGVLGNEPAIDLDRLPPRDGEESSRRLRRRGAVARELSLVALGPVRSLDDGPPTQLSRIDGLLVEIAEASEARCLVALADHLASVTPHERSRLPVRVRVPALSKPEAWLEQACADALPALRARVANLAVEASSGPATAALDALIDAAAERDRGKLDAWLREHPEEYTRALRQVEGYLADHPDSPHRDALLAEVETRRADRVRRWRQLPALLAGAAALVALTWFGAAWMRDGERLDHARRFEGDGAPQRWLAIDAYRAYLNGRTWASTASRTAEARRRIAALTLAVLRDDAVEPSELERHVDLADRLATEQPDHPAVAEELPALRRALLRRIASRDASALLAPLEADGADLDDLDAVATRLEARLGAPLPDAIARRLAALRAERARRADLAADRALWKAVLDAAGGSDVVADRIAAYERYLGQRPRGAYAERAREAIRREQRARETESWESVADTLAARSTSTREKIDAIDDYLRAHPRATNAREASAVRARLARRLVAEDWKTTQAAVGKAREGELPPQIAALRAHLRRVADHADEAHVRTVRARINQLLARLDDQTYVRLKEWFSGDPQAAATIDAGFADYLKAFPAGRHRKAAAGFREWWKNLQTERTYTIELQSVRLNRSKLGRWNDKPDCYVVLSSGKQAFKSPVKKGYGPTWTGQKYKIRWKPGAAMRVTVWDKDYRWDDKIFSIDIKGPVALARLRQRLSSSKGHTIQLRCADFPWPDLP